MKETRLGVSRQKGLAGELLRQGSSYSHGAEINRVNALDSGVFVGGVEADTAGRNLKFAASVSLGVGPSCSVSFSCAFASLGGAAAALFLDAT